MFEIYWKRHELVGTREFDRYPPGRSVDFQALFPHRKGRS